MQTIGALMMAELTASGVGQDTMTEVFVQAATQDAAMMVDIYTTDPVAFTAAAQETSSSGGMTAATLAQTITAECDGQCEYCGFCKSCDRIGRRYANPIVSTEAWRTGMPNTAYEPAGYDPND